MKLDGFKALLFFKGGESWYHHLGINTQKKLPAPPTRRIFRLNPLLNYR